MRKSFYVLMLAVVVTLGLSACGSSNSGSTTKTAASHGDSKEKILAEAQAVLKKYEVRPTSLPQPLPPIGKPVPSGKKIVYIGCGIPNCVLVGEVVKHAAQHLGWQTQILETNGTATQIQNAWTQALRENPYGIVFGATERSLIQKYLTEAEKRGILVTAAATNEPNGAPSIGKGIDFNIGSEDEDEGAFAAFMAENTNAGESPALLVTIQGLPTFEHEVKDLKDDLAKLCSGCSMQTLEISVEQFANASTLIVSYLRSHPEIKVMVLSADDILGGGLPAALDAAGLNGVKFMGGGGDSTTLQYIETGKEWATIAGPLPELSYGMVDYLARRAAGVKPIPAMPRLSWVLTKGHIPNVNGGFPVVANVESQYVKAWGK